LLTRRQLGDVVALAPAGILLFLGSAWMDVLWPFQVVYMGAVVFGLGAILALEREDLFGDALACLCLTIAIGWSALGPPSCPVSAPASWLAGGYLAASGSWPCRRRPTCFGC
jgi:hypothetical protein